ncbi:hypothetical protein AGABI2DRAFT_142251 [Agaricus bisporus var. bisporus H97]|uniref:hypothetical protein n=1 Tax=Agaricus bisporus var. bisporus (strain H97 / ATCC MYA-4626 / FGSC 10389) TaxID=936046 RepID=UPI00029F5D51|nr:hypothetical protein AGABI2DRAFT_142251 [Agaricus bisporus var. bisporus H97]EKV47974.1 hypothetical protein AGABI2DRAFT_142251 [Agaricus bisporus var. bisporus H97]
MYSCYLAPQNSDVTYYEQYQPREKEKKKAKAALEQAISVFREEIRWISNEREPEWVLMGRGHTHDLESDEAVYHWTVRGFFGEHAEMTLHVYGRGGGREPRFFANGGCWGEGQRKKGEFIVREW